MPKRVRPYGSADDAESAALARNRSRSGRELSGAPAGTTEVRGIVRPGAHAPLAPAGRAADMMAAALTQAGQAPSELRRSSLSLRRADLDRDRLAQGLPHR